jgi:lipid-A-disaccharide synthase
VACYREAHKEWCEEQYQKLGTTLPIEFHLGKTSEIIEIADCCAMVSGSVSLELLARCTPAIVVYNCGLTMWLMAHLLREIDYISLPNLFENRAIYPEFYHTGPLMRKMDGMFEVIDDWLTHPERLDAKREEIERLKLQTVQFGAISKTADAVLRYFPETASRKAA